MVPYAEIQVKSMENLTNLTDSFMGRISWHEDQTERPEVCSSLTVLEIRIF